MCWNCRAVLNWSLLVALTCSSSLAWAQTPRAKAPINLDYVTPDAMAAVVVYPRHVLTAPEYELLPIEVLSAAAQKEWGLDPVDIEQVVAFVALPQAGASPGGAPPSMMPSMGLPQFAIVLHMASTVKPDKILEPLQTETVAAQIAGKPYRKATNPMLGLSIFCPDDHTVLLASDGLLQKLVGHAKDQKPGPMRNMLSHMQTPADATAIVLVEPLRPMLAMAQGMAPMPPEFADALKLPELLTSIGAKLSVTDGFSATVAFRANNENAAQEVEKILDKLQAASREKELAQAEEMLKNEDPIQQALGRWMKRTADQRAKLNRPERMGQTLVFSTEGDPEKKSKLVSTAVAGIATSLLLPAVQAARQAAREAAGMHTLSGAVEIHLGDKPAQEDTPNFSFSPPVGNTKSSTALPQEEAAKQAQAANNMKLILLAMLNSESAVKQFPTQAILDVNGKPLLSWRVHLLPYMEQGKLYKEFHLNEPWDSEHNKTLIAKMPAFYSIPGEKPAQGMTPYLAVCGKGLAFEIGAKQGRAVSDIKDGTSNTIFFVEANPDRTVIWTQPDDWQYDAKKPMGGLGAAHPTGFFAGFADGSVHLLTKDLPPATFGILLMIAEGQLVKIPRK